MAIVLAVVALTVIPATAAHGGPGDGGTRSDRAPNDQLLYSSFLGGNGVDWAHAVDLGPDGSIYITGYTSSLDFPTTVDAYQRSPGGEMDAFVLKLSTGGGDIEWATLLGGSDDDIAWDIDLGPDGRVYVTGETKSSDFPFTLTAISRILFGTQDAFVTCLNATDGTMVYSTYLGGEGTEEGSSIVALDDGTAYVAGQTTSVAFPATLDAYDTGLNGNSDAFLALVGRSGSRLLKATYLGGRYTEVEPELLYQEGRLWVAGSTTSDNFPQSHSAFDTTPKAGLDTFLTEMDLDLGGIGLSVVLGGSSNDVPRSLDIDIGGRALIGGFTSSSNLRTTSNAIASYQVGGTDGYLVVIDTTGPTLEYGTYVGGGAFDAIRTARFDARGLVHAVGYTNSSGDFPTTPDAYMYQGYADDHDAFYMELSLDGERANHSTLLGHRNGDFGMDMELGRHDIPVLVGHSRSADFPVTSGALDTTYNGGGDAVVVTYSADAEPPRFLEDLTPDKAETGGALAFTVRIWDRIGLDEAQVVYRFDDGEESVRDLLEGQTHVRYVDVPRDAESVSYRFTARDLLGRFNETDWRTIDVADVIPPMLVIDLTPEQATTGDPLTFAARLEDNIALRRAHVEYDLWNVTGNESLEALAYPAGALGVSIMMDEGSLDPVRYRFTFEDAAGNANSTPWHIVPVVDDDPPTIEPLDLPETATPGSSLNIIVDADDNVGISKARIEYAFGPLTPTVEEVEYPFTPFIYFIVDIGRDEEEDLILTVYVEDAAGNVVSVPGVVTVADTMAPWIVEFTSQGNATTGDPFLVSWEAVDEVAVQQMWVRFLFGEGTLEDYEFQGVDAIRIATLDIPVPADAEGPLWIIYGARDGSFNTNETGPYRFDVVDDDPPVARAGEDLRVEAKQGVHLTAAASTDNVGIVNFQWVWLVPGAEETLLRETASQEVVLDLEPGDYTIELRAFDAHGNVGRDTVTVTVVGATSSGEASGPLWVYFGLAVITFAIAGYYLAIDWKRRRTR